MPSTPLSLKVLSLYGDRPDVNYSMIAGTPTLRSRPSVVEV